jgi:hypothetical protein
VFTPLHDPVSTPPTFSPIPLSDFTPTPPPTPAPPDPPPVLSDETNVRIFAFEKKQMEYKFSMCECCRNRRIFVEHLTLGKWPIRMCVQTNVLQYMTGLWCTVCRRDYVAEVNKQKPEGAIPRLGCLNNMHPSDIPSHLPPLRYVEEAFIARIKCIISVHVLSTGMLASKGHTLSFCRDFLLRDLAVRLPRWPVDVQFLLIASKGKDATQGRHLWARRVVVHVWLTYLLTQPHYAGVTLDHKALAALPDDGPVLTPETLVIDESEFKQDDGPAPAQNTTGGDVDSFEVFFVYRFYVSNCFMFPRTLSRHVLLYCKLMECLVMLTAKSKTYSRHWVKI